ncbi:hypothetical protein [Dyella acidiphila]|uniref:Uncharacterized protein n=1 Tax=Dyella acidiphila TaxID=2775866 RepID=A0ABR9G9G2_9GAMM|nr:hypothetical protein [Dyella acidiphila]MBE1160676.1 hypothetical protein [Dyella acidiphila]
MTIRNRESLRSYFSDGALPTQEHFADLIDSMLNMSDEGFRKSVERGFEISAAAGYEALLSFFRDQDPDLPLWSVLFGGAQGQLLIRANGEPPADGETDTRPPLLCLDPSGRIGIRNASPAAALDIDGMLRSKGRSGSYARAHAVPLLANGQWQDLTDDLDGCQAFEVTAGAGHQGKGSFALVHAVALNTYNPTLGILNFLNRKRGIRSTDAFYARRCDRLQLRWQGSSGRNASYRLQIRSGCDYGSGIAINAHVTQLWFDPHMQKGQP